MTIFHRIAAAVTKVGHVSEVCRKDSTSANAAQTKKNEAQKPAAPSRLQWQIKHPNKDPQPAVVLSAAAEISPKLYGHEAAPSSVLDANLGTNVASASNAPLPVQSAPVPPKDHLFPATFAAASPQCADVSAGVDNNSLAATSVAASSVPIHASSSKISAIAEECSLPPQFNSPILVAASKILQPTPEANHLPWASPLQNQSHQQQTLLPSTSAPSPLPKQPAKSYADILLGVQLSGMPYSVSFKPRFHAIKLTEYPSLPLPNFRIFFSARPLFPQDSLEEPSSPRPADSFQMYSEGDDVPRQPIQRKKLSTFLRSSYLDLNAKLKKGRRPEIYPVSFNRKKWKKLTPYSQPDPTSTSNTNNAPPTAEEDPGDDSLVEYESNWHSYTSDDEADINYENLLGFDEEYLPMDYSDFSFALPLQTRRKYNKRFRDLPPASYPKL